MIVGKVKQQNLTLSIDNSMIAYRYSENLQLLVTYDDTYTDYSISWSLLYQKDRKPCKLAYDVKTKCITLPKECFSANEYVYLSCAFVKGNEVVTLDPIELYIPQSVDPLLQVEPEEHGWYEEARQLFEQIWLQEYKPLLDDLSSSLHQQVDTLVESTTTIVNELQEEAKTQQALVLQNIDQMNQMASDGVFDGSYWLYGNGAPNANVGKVRDWYLDLNTVLWDIYQKKEDGWFKTDHHLLGEKGGLGGDTVPIGVMMTYQNNTPPQGWLLCDGREVSRTEFADLFAIIGTSYGEGDGSTTFNLPLEPNPITYSSINDNVVQLLSHEPILYTIIKAFQSVPIVASVEQSLESKSTINTPSVKSVYEMVYAADGRSLQSSVMQIPPGAKIDDGTIAFSKVDLNTLRHNVSAYCRNSINKPGDPN